MADAKLSIRCSSLPILSTCFGMLGADLTVGIASEVAQTGTDVHAYAAQLIREGKAPDIATMDADFSFLASRVRMAWEALKEQFPHPIVEKHLAQSLPKFDISGHPDLYGIEDVVATVLDFKSGYKTDADVLPQLLGYCYLVGAEHKEVERFEIIVCWLRDKDIQEWTFTRAEVREWIGALHRRAASWNGRDFTAGDHCQYCPRFHDCPARAQLARSAVLDILGLDLTTATRGQLAERLPDLYSRVQMVEKQIDLFRKWLREDLEKNGRMICGPGKVLELKDQNVQVLDVQKGWKIFAGCLDEAALNDCLSISKTKLLAAVGAKSAPRMKGKDQAAVMKALEEVGAISLRPKKVLTWTKGESDAE